MLSQRGLARQVREELRARILDGRLAKGSQLPAEVDLARTLGVSRTSLREALLQLEQDGLLIRRHGYGTFVRSPHLLQTTLNANLSATELIRAHGMVPGTTDIQVTPTQATEHEAAQLEIDEGEDVIVLERVRTADGRPVVFTRDVIPTRLFREADVDSLELAREDLSLYRFFAERLGRSVVDGRARLRSDIAAPWLAAKLGVEVGSTILVIEQVDSDDAEQRLLLSWEHYVTDAIEFVIHRRGPQIPVPATRSLDSAQPELRDASGPAARK